MKAFHPWEVPEVWAQAYASLDSAIRQGGEHTERSVFQALINGHMVLWANDDVWIVTSWCDYPAARIGFVLFAGGTNARKWVADVTEQLSQWAKSMGCKELRMCGRKGWGRLVDNAEASLVLTRVL